ncbi:EIN3-binding F-box protein 1-like isoform X2 [Gastrolobium bilobum]|uniref:EIN3-binding F-box protein 1-like isoform X2 n=1 Tax=Gastrolobium bilobum TaxID=150636 RepID=UPI002AAF25AC|nr:EIN3-binding F-box protein 1-like isoform X2 [Gastrolobium bilobum]
MPTLVNYSGDDELYPGGSFCPNPMDLGRLYTIGSNVDVYYPPTKRARISVPFIFEALEREQYQKPGIEVLPDECLFEIFRRLPSGKERSSCACVSKRWLMLMSSICRAEIERTTSSDVEMVSSDENQDIEGDGYLTRCLEGKKATDVRLAAIAVGTSGRGGLGKLSIRGSNSVRGVTNLGLSAVSHGCPSLRSLSLWNVSSIGDEGLSEIAKGCHMLEKLDLCLSSSISNKGLIAIAEGCPSLTTLNIESCSKIGNEGLQAIARSCPKLQSISIKDCPLVGDHGVSSLLSSASNLSRVKLQALNITDFSLAVIGHYGKAITNLVLCGLQNVSERGFWVMGVAQGLQKIVSFTITSCRGVTDASIEAMGKGCNNLKQMCLRKCCFVSDSGLVAFAKAAVSLESLHLEECNRVTQSGIIGALSNIKTKLKSLTLVKCMGVKDIDVEVSMLSPCESLRSLAIQNCPGFGSASLAMIGKLCPQLQHVDLTGLYGITDAGLLPLLENCEAGLVKVNLTGCWNLTDNAVSSLARLHGGTLELLNLDGCWKITDASLVAIADNCLLLNDLDVSKCAITDAGVAVLSGATQLSLQVLSLSGCSDVSNKSVPFLKKLGQTLLGLNLQNCNSIGSSTIELLLENLWRCDILA